MKTARGRRNGSNLYINTPETFGTACSFVSEGKIAYWGEPGTETLYNSMLAANDSMSNRKSTCGLPLSEIMAH